MARKRRRQRTTLYAAGHDHPALQTDLFTATDLLVSGRAPHAHWGPYPPRHATGEDAACEIERIRNVSTADSCDIHFAAPQWAVTGQSVVL